MTEPEPEKDDVESSAEGSAFNATVKIEENEEDD